ncbi:MAG: transposase [Anaerolineae bacterium]
MKYDPERHHRHSIRLKGYEYSQCGAYFVTICTQERACVLGEIVDGKMQVNGWGKIVRQFKTFSARRINDLRGTPGIPLWQRNYYEHIIRNNGELDRIRQYIHDNPANWTEDEDNPDTGCGNRRLCNGTPKLRPRYYMPQKGGKS